MSAKPVLLVLLASLVAAVLVVVIMGVLGEYTETRGRILLTALSLGGCSLLALPPSVLAQRDDHGYLGYAGLGVAVVAYLLVVVGIWGTPNSDGYWKAAGIASIFAGAFFQVCWLMLMTPRLPLAGVARPISLGATGLAAILATIGIILEIKTAPYWWALVIILIVELLTGLAAPVLNRWNFRLNRDAG